MIRLAVVVEGPTEEAFVKDVLAEHLLPLGVEPIPNVLHGDVTVAKQASRMALLFWSYDRVTSLVDFYGFRGKGNDTVDDLELRIRAAAIAEINRSMDESRIIPYVQIHEFEALLFSNVTAFGNVPGASPQTVPQLANIRSQFTTPEDINDSPYTAPSKRIEQFIPRYNKRANSPTIAKEIGLSTIRRECPRFDAWVTRLESLTL